MLCASSSCQKIVSNNKIVKTSYSYDDPVPLDLVKRRRFFHNEPLTLKAALLLSEAAFEHGVSSEYLNCVRRIHWGF